MPASVCRRVNAGAAAAACPMEWDTSTGTTTNDYNHAAGIETLINGEDVARPAITLTNQNGLTSSLREPEVLSRTS